ncbi:hypothetical protein ASD65_06260 [Microbacterium sp. Root61]|uniref:hypothetical protein n=1 Tax=Microbacterium sp. Root61 TaxID=1736570 RepID=UPI0006FEB7F0|nr:hypothetical protein [Microbacterium sp. Root61]KRA24072.1 hypothetical protein ASD65_06260 [Microbacterium sp. Root61]
MEEPNRFQIILSETRRTDLVESERQRAEIERFIGRYMVDWGYVEFFMSISIDAWVTPRSIGNLQRAMLTQPTSSKINFIRGLLPETWVSGAALIRHLEDGNQYRNSLAHSNLAMGGFDGERRRGWHLWNVRGRDIRLDLPEEERNDRLARVSVLREAVRLLMHDEIRSASGDLDLISLSSLIVQQPGTWHTWEEWGHFTRVACEMFPDSSNRK